MTTYNDKNGNVYVFQNGEMLPINTSKIYYDKNYVAYEVKNGELVEYKPVYKQWVVIRDKNGVYTQYNEDGSTERYFSEK